MGHDEMDILWFAVYIAVSVAAWAFYRRARYAYILRKRARRDRPRQVTLRARGHSRPVRIMTSIDLASGGLHYGKP